MINFDSRKKLFIQTVYMEWAFVWQQRRKN